MTDWNKNYNDSPPVRGFPKTNDFPDGMYNLEIVEVRFFQKKDSLVDIAVFEMLVTDGPEKGALASRMFMFDPGATLDKIKRVLGMYRHFVHTCLNGHDVPPNDLELKGAMDQFIGVRLRGELKNKFWENNMVKIEPGKPGAPPDDNPMTDADVADAENDGLDERPF